MSGISLTASMRSNLLSLQNIASQQDIVQNRLATGLKVSSAIDNPSSYYTASSLNNRAADLTALLDAMSQGVQTIKAASEAIESGTKFLEQAKAVVSQTLEINNNVSAVVSNETELLDAITSGKEGLIVIKGKITLSDNIELKLSDGQSLVGAEYAYGTAATPSELVFNTTDGTGRAAISAGSNSVISDLKISYASNAAGADLKGAVTVENAENVKINNLDLTFDVAAGNTNYNKSAVYVSNSKNVVLSGDVKILAKDKSRVFQAYNNSEVFFENITADFESEKASGIYTQQSTINFGRNATVNILTHEAECMGFDIRQGKIIIEDNARINIQTMGEKSYAVLGYSDSYLSVTGQAKLNIITEEDSSYGIYGIQSPLTVTASGQSQINILTKGYDSEGIKNAICNFNERSIINIECRGTNGDGFNNCEVTMRGNSKLRTHGVGSNSSAINYGKFDIYDQTEVLFNGKLVDLYGVTNNLCYFNIYSDKAQIFLTSAAMAHNTSVVITAVTGSVINTTGGSYQADNAITVPSKPVSGKVPPAGFNRVGDAVMPSMPDIEEEMKDNQAPREKDNDGGTLGDISKNKAQFDEIIKQYDTLINDASYKGINLLSGQNLKINFNEDRSSKIDVAGVKANSQSLGISFSDWTNKATVEKSLSELENAISSLRSFASEFGNYYSIVTTRQDFTENLINVLEEGADKLTLADMNQESANMLALQTSQQLAVNSLSLASQASQAVLKLF